MLKKENIKIKGMHCASCASNITISLKKLKGIEKADVILATEKAYVEYDDKLVDLDKIKKAITEVGYEVASDQEEKMIADKKYEKEQAIKTTLAVILALPLFVRMFWMWEIPGFFMDIKTTDWVQMFFSFIIVFFLGWQFHKTTYTQIKKGKTGMDTLISLGTLSAFFYSLWALFVGGHIYFESAATITSFILLGKYLELKTKNKANKAMEKLLELNVKKAIVEKNGQEKEEKLENIKINDILVVKAGEKIALDGEIILGETSIDEAMFTGESLPVSKKIGDKVFGATMNIGGVIKVRVEKAMGETALDTIIKTVEEAQSFKAPTQKLADKIAAIFVPTVVALSLITFGSWYYFSGNIEISFINAVAVLIISCPCALGLATPIAIMVGTSVGARRGILFKNGEIFEKGKNIDVVMFDKTGTLTEGKPEVKKIIVNNEFDYKEEKIMDIAISLAINSNHPLSVAIKEFVGDKKIKKATDFGELAGYGLKGIYDKEQILLGNKSLMAENKINTSWIDKILEEQKTKEGTFIFVSYGDKVIGAINLIDKIKKDAQQTIKNIKAMGLKPIMLSGDNKNTVKAVAEKLEIEEYFSEVLPEQKQQQVKIIQDKNIKVAFVGDGINDAPSLAQADLGIAMASGTDIAKETGDIVIMKNNPQKVVEAIKLSKKTFFIIKQNLFWAFFYNILAIPLAMAGLVNPMIGALAMSFSDVTIIGNSLRIYNQKKDN